MEQGDKFKLITIAIALLIVLTVSVASCFAQVKAKHFHVVQSCHEGKCSKVKRGSLAITPDSIFIKVDGVFQEFKILKKSHVNNYDLYEFESFTFIKVFDHYAQVIKWNDIQTLTIIKA
jgi:hypothetical protein